MIISLEATYYGDSLIESYMEKQEDKEAMLMIRIELAANLKELEDIRMHYLKEIKYSEALVNTLIRNKVPLNRPTYLLQIQTDVAYIINV